MTLYLLGELPEQEQITLEEKYFVDDDCFAQLLAVEDDLIDDYVRGLLSEHERKLFENHFLVTPQRRERLEISRALRGSISLAQASTAPLTVSKELTSWWASIL